MIQLVRDLFKQNGFNETECEYFYLYSMPLESKRQAYWILLEAQLETIINHQSLVFQKCKEIGVETDFDKNASMLILHRVADEEANNQAKNQILIVEEDGYFFRKFVLPYGDDELKQFTSNRGERPTNEYLTSVMEKQNCFSEYKKSPRALSWQSLVYRLAHKLPFIKLRIKAENGLTTLYERNQQNLKHKNQSDFDTIFEEALGAFDYNYLDKMNGEDLLKMLINRKNNGAKN